MVRTSFQVGPKTRRTFRALLAFSLAIGVFGPAHALSQTQRVVPYSQPLAVIISPSAQAAPEVNAVHNLMVPLAKAFKKRKFASVCRESEAVYAALMAQAAPLFFGPDRKKAEPVAIERFLDRHVRTKVASLEIIDEGFAPAPAWRSMIAAACISADQAAVAVRLLGAAAAHAPHGTIAASFAVALAAQHRDWAIGAAALGTNATVSADLLRGLAAPAQSVSYIEKAAARARTEWETTAVEAVKHHVAKTRSTP